MSARSTEQLIDLLAGQAQPVRPLASPGRRAAVTLLMLGAAAAAAVAVAGDVSGLLARYNGREVLMVAEMAAMMLTAVLAVLGAFAMAVPGGSRRWLLAPLVPLTTWFALSGLGCVFSDGAWAPADHDCFTFIVAAGTLAGAPLLWRLARTRPIDPLPVALLGGLGAAATAAFILQFFHPFPLTFLDLALHTAAVLALLAAATLLRRWTLRPA